MLPDTLNSKQISIESTIGDLISLSILQNPEVRAYEYKVNNLLIEKKLKDPKNGLAGYTELQQWIEKEFNKEVKYNTILKYAMRNFGSSVKVARKSHVKKDELAVESFKKASFKK
jgi:transposase